MRGIGTMESIAAWASALLIISATIGKQRFDKFRRIWHERCLGTGHGNSGVRTFGKGRQEGGEKFRDAEKVSGCSFCNRQSQTSTLNHAI